MSIIKVYWYVLKMKNIHFGSPSVPRPCLGFMRQRKAGLRVDYVIRQEKATALILISFTNISKYLLLDIIIEFSY